MKKRLAIILFIVIVIIVSCKKLNAQAGSSIIGSWKIASVTVEDYYYHVKKDSLAVNPTLTEAYPDSLLNEMKKYVRMLHADTEFHFLPNGKYIIRLLNTSEISGNFKALPRKKQIEVTSKNGLNEYVTDYWPYKVLNGLMHLDWLIEDRSLHMTLEKINE